MYWCYVDESWAETEKEKMGVLAAAVGPQDAFERLDRFMYKMRRKYYGEEHARNRERELKGADLFSSNSFKMAEKHGYSKNLWLDRCRLYHNLVSDCQLHTVGQNGRSVYGLIRLQQQSDGSYTVRRERTASQKEKESGASGKEAC